MLSPQLRDPERTHMHRRTAVHVLLQRCEPRGRGSWFISRRIVSPNDPLTPSPWSINGSEIRVQIQSYNSFSVYVPDSYDIRNDHVIFGGVPPE